MGKTNIWLRGLRVEGGNTVLCGNQESNWVDQETKSIGRIGKLRRLTRVVRLDRCMGV